MTVKFESRPWHGMPEALLLAVALLALSFSRIVGDVSSMAFQHRIIDSVLAGPIWGTTLVRNIVVYVITLLALHAALGLLSWALARVSRAAWPTAAISVRQWLFIWFIGTTAWVLVANATLYPNSSLGAPYAEIMRASLFGVTPLTIATVVLSIAAIAACACALARLPRLVTRRRFAVAAGALAACAAVFGLTPADLKGEPVPSRAPHVILIGIDSLRPDAVAPHTVAIAGFLQRAATFTDAITPLARTFPAWVATLTGRHPHTTGGVMNLLPRDLVRTGETLPDALRRAGYATAYAIDEVKFSNIDASYGFDTVIAPPMGASEFLLTRIIDTPLSNLVVNTWLGAIALPHLHANRGAAATYDPDTFVHRLDASLRFDRQTFLALHLTLAHWPFVWSDAPATAQNSPEARATEYAHAIRRVDRQFRDVMLLLERKGALDNALVIVMSDHGEALGQHRDSSIPPTQDATVARLFKEIYGHGTSVLSPPQYQIVLGMRSYGTHLRRIGAGAIDAPVSLEDLAPTVMELLGRRTESRYDGRSLVPLFDPAAGAHDSFRQRIRFTETEFNPQDIFVGGTISASGAAKAALFYRISPSTDRIELRRELLPVVLAQREYAAILGDQLLVALPEVTLGKFKLVALDRRRGYPKHLATAPSESAEPKIARLWHALHARFDLVESVAPGT